MKTSSSLLLSAAVIACSLLGCGGGSNASDAGVSNAPPTISLTDASDRYQQQSTLTFTATVKASAGSTVTAAWTAVGQGAPLKAVAGPNGLYTFTNVPLSGGHNTIVVYAEDSAGHSGKSSPAPYHANLSVTVDTTAPTLTFDASVASYFDERTISVLTDAGVPAVPPQYSFPGSPTKVAVDATHPVYKISSRLASGGSLAATALESDNPSNTPFLRFTAPFSAASDAPITVSYAAATTCSGSGCDATVFTDTGTLLAAAETDPSNALFDLPLSTESLSALGKIQASPAHVVLTLIAKDAAGNQSQLTLPSFDIHVLGAPVVAREDTGYAQTGDIHSIHSYSLASGNYGSLWTGTNAGELARAFRYVLYNPYSTPIAFQISNTGSADVQEKVDTVSVGSDVTSSFCNDVGFCSPGLITWVMSSSGTGCPANNMPFNFSTQYPKVFATSPSLSFVNLPSPTGAGTPGTLATYSTYSVASSVHAASAGEPSAPPLLGRYVIPAASGTTPGTAVVYVGRPWQSVHYPTLKYGPLSGTQMPQGFYGPDSWEWYTGWSFQSFPCSGGGSYLTAPYHGVVVSTQLTQAQEQWDGTVTLTPYAVSADGQHQLGEAGPVTAQTFDSVFEH